MKRFGISGAVVAIGIALAGSVAQGPSTSVRLHADDEDNLACPVTHDVLRAALITANKKPRGLQTRG